MAPYGDFNEYAMAVWDFARCQRSDGSVYGTGGTCRLGTKIGDKKEPLTGKDLLSATKKLLNSGVSTPEEWAKGTGYVLKNGNGDVKAFRQATREARGVAEAEKKIQAKQKPKMTEEEKRQREEKKKQREEAKRQKEEEKKQQLEETLKRAPRLKDTGLNPEDEKLLGRALTRQHLMLSLENEKLPARLNLENLSTDERAAILLYSGAPVTEARRIPHVYINQFLRYGKFEGDDDPDTKALVDYTVNNVKSALENLPPANIRENQRLARSVRGRTAEAIKKLKVGEEFSDKGIGSYTLNDNTLNTFLHDKNDVVVRVVNPKNAKDVGLGTMVQSADEHLYAPGSKFRVVSIKPEDYYNEEGNFSVTQIDVEEVN
jgi:hypothetical protein